MHLVEIPERNFRKEIPSCLEEMRPEEWVFLAGLLYDLNRERIDVTDLQTMLIYKLLNVGHNKKKYLKLPDEDKFRIAENLFFISEHIDFIFIEDFLEGKPVLKFNFNFVHNPVPEIPRKPLAGIYHKLNGPADALQDITFRQYVDAHAYFESYTRDNDLAALDKLVSVLYLPRGKKHDLNKLEARARKISRLPIGYRFGVYLFFVACEQFLREGEVDFEGEKIKLKLLYESTMKERRLQDKQKYKVKASLTSVAFSLARTNIFGPIEQVMEQNLYDILYLLYQQRIDYLNQLEDYDQDQNI